MYSSWLTRLLHDRTANRIAAAISQLPHANATIVPFQLRERSVPTSDRDRVPEAGSRVGGTAEETGRQPDSAALGTIPIGELQWRQRARIEGTVRSVTVPTSGTTGNLEATVFDESGGLTLVFTRRAVPGVENGARLVVEGVVGKADGHLAMVNPTVDRVANPPEKDGAKSR
jgi:hypothetical protein